MLALLEAMRPRQWAKNVILFAALVFDEKLLNSGSLGRTLAGFALFCLVSGAVYLINDLSDLQADREHPRKRKRPLPSGRLSVRSAILAVIVIAGAGLPLAFWLSLEFGGLLTAYLLLNLAYSRWLKHIPLIDVLVLASFYLLRVQAGVVLVVVERFSPWLYIVTTLLALYIGFGKRRAELAALDGASATSRRVLDGYTLPFLDQLLNILTATTLMAYSLYTFSAPNLPDNHVMMLTIPFVLYGLFRYLYLVQVLQMGGAPEEIAFSDRPLQVTILLWGLAVVGLLYWF